MNQQPTARTADPASPNRSRVAPAGLGRLRELVDALDALVARTEDEAILLTEGGQALARLIAEDDWLPESHAQPSPQRYQQYPLYVDAAGRYSVVSFVWGPGQNTPVHDHTVWGLVGVLRGAEIAERFTIGAGRIESLGSERLESGMVDAVSPRVGDIHRVRNAYADRVSISIHVYGADIGAVRRHIYDDSGQSRPFISGYANAPALSF
jgi:predicted metal-dependent enzyme (double-stranded beta helix superfamily)